MPAILAFVIANWRWISLVVGVLAMLGVGTAYIAKVKHDAYVDGYQVGYATARGEDEKKMRDMEIANQDAINKSAKMIDELQKNLVSKETEIDEYLKSVDLAADQDPSGSLACLDVDSVRRLSAIQ